MKNHLRYELDENEIPKSWYNIVPDLPQQLPPPLSPVTNEPIDPKDLEVLFAKELIKQEISDRSEINIPQKLRDKFINIRPSPLIRAVALEKYLKTKSRIYFKYEGEKSPTGSHKINTAIAQAYYNAKEGIEALTTETGAGQWGSALSYSAQLFDLDCKVLMVRASYDQKPYRRTIMELYGAEIYPSPSEMTEFGKKLLKENPENPGSLGIAISEAITLALQNDKMNYSLGSVLNHVLIHQSIIGLEAIEQFKQAENNPLPDFIVGCVGGGSNFAGLSYPFLQHKIKNGSDIGLKAIAAESTAASKMCDGDYRYDFGDTANLTPLLKMYTLGSDFIPPPIHAGGLRYHGVAPSLSVLINTGYVTPVKYNQEQAFEAGKVFSRCEGIVPAPESCHAIVTVIDLAKKYRDDDITILFNLSGHGLFDLAGYQQYLSNTH